jgi:hypothetical protein
MQQTANRRRVNSFFISNRIDFKGAKLEMFCVYRIFAAQFLPHVGKQIQRVRPPEWH